jgi:hypothetical protein
VRPPPERQLTRRFGPLPPEAVDRIHQAALPQLESWLDSIIDAPSMQAVFEERWAGTRAFARAPSLGTIPETRGLQPLSRQGGG